MSRKRYRKFVTVSKVFPESLIYMRVMILLIVKILIS